MAAAAPKPHNPTPLSDAQYAVWSHPARFRVMVAGRRFGKTYLGDHELVRAAQVAPGNKRVWFIAPTYRQAQQIAWEELKRIIPPRLVAKKNETDLSIRLAHYGSEIALRGADNFDSLRGVGLDFVVLDEYADMDPRAWQEVIRPALSDRGGEALFLGTPRGFNHFYDLFIHAQSAPDWKAFQFTTVDGGNVPESEVELARRELDPRVFRQEYEASFETLAGRVYYAFDRKHNLRSDLSDTGGTLMVGMDFNVNPMSAVLAVRAADQLHVLDEIVIENSNTTEMAATIREWRSRSVKPDRAVSIYPDPSGNARKSSAPVGETDFTILRQFGFAVLAPPAHTPVVDRINVVNSLACNAANERRLFVHPRCKHLVKSLEGLTYKEGTSAPDKGSGLDHVADALAYLCDWEFPIVKRPSPMQLSTVPLLGV